MKKLNSPIETIPGISTRAAASIIGEFGDKMCAFCMPICYFLP